LTKRYFNAKILFMNARFVRVGWGLERTDAFLHFSVFKEYIQSLQRGVEVDQTTKMNEEMAQLAQDRMEEEINQTIRTCDQLTKDELIEYTTGWVEYFKRALANTSNIKNEIDTYNDKTILEFEQYVQMQEAKFKETKEYKTLNHLEFYEEEQRSFGGLISLFDRAMPQKRLVQYRKFIELKVPDLIDIEFLPQYMHFIKPIIQRCINIVEKRLPYLHSTSPVKQLPSIVLPEKEVEQSEPNFSRQGDKLKVNLSVKQLIYLFKMLHSTKLFNVSRLNEIQKFVSANFETVATSGKEDISVARLAKLWSEKDPSIAAYWTDKFIDLHNLAKKDNPLNLKNK